MAIDAQTLFSDKQALAAADSTNIVKVPKNDIGKGHPIYLFAIVADADTAPGMLTIVVKTSNDSGMAGAETIATYEVHNDKVVRGGSVLSAAIPTGCKEFLRLSYSDVTVGAITIGLVLAAQTNGI